MTAKRPTKSQRAAKRRSKARSAARDNRKPLTPLAIWAIQVAETLKELELAVGNEDKARWILSDMMRLPDWIIPNPDLIPFEDDDEEDE